MFFSTDYLNLQDRLNNMYMACKITTCLLYFKLYNLEQGATTNTLTI